MPSGLEGSGNGDSSLRERGNMRGGEQGREQVEVGEGIPTETLTKREKAGGLASSQVF